MKRKTYFKIILAFSLGIVTFLLLEISLRIIKMTYGDPIKFYKDFHLTQSQGYWAEQLEEFNDSRQVKTDPDMGWTLSPNFVSKDSTIIHNSIGVRSAEEYTPKRSAKLRIGIFGDSFTYGHDVSNEESWGFHLEQSLRDSGIDCEVLNWGVPGYGMDQAYLRYLKDGKDMDLDIVIFGLQLENFWRNLNVFRPCYTHGSGIPLSKPRGIIQNDSLVFTNVPTLPKSEITHYLFEPEAYPQLWKHEYFSEPKIVRNLGIFSNIYAIETFQGLLYPAKHPTKGPLMENHPEGLELMTKIVSDFNDRVQETDAKFFILQLPIPYEIRHIKQECAHPHEALLNDLLQDYNACRVDSILVNYRVSAIFNGHYTPLGNKVIGKHFAIWLFQNESFRNKYSKLSSGKFPQLSNSSEVPNFE